MAISSSDARTLLMNALNLNTEEVASTTKSKLKCLICSKRAYQSSSYVYCTSNITSHRKTNLIYLTELLDLYETLLKAKNDDTLKGGSSFL